MPKILILTWVWPSLRPPPLNNVKSAELVRDGFHYLPSFQASNGIRLLKIGDNVEMWGQGVVRSADILSKMCWILANRHQPTFSASKTKKLVKIQSTYSISRTPKISNRHQLAFSIFGPEFWVGKTDSAMKTMFFGEHKRPFSIWWQGRTKRLRQFIPAQCWSRNR